jgi:hypothetical protein
MIPTSADLAREDLPINIAVQHTELRDKEHGHGR